jgi:hypothetical protein
MNPEIHYIDRRCCDGACYDRTRKRKDRAKKCRSIVSEVDPLSSLLLCRFSIVHFGEDLFQAHL